MHGRDLPQLLLLLTQITLAPLRVLAAEEILQLLREPPGLTPRRLVRLARLTDTALREPVRFVLSGEPPQFLVAGLGGL